MDRDVDRQAEILAAALDLEGEDRAAYLARACAGDAELRQEIESLLAADAAAVESFVDRAQPVSGILSALRGQMLAGSHLAHYAIESKLGSGGAGVVYRALDTNTNTTVALKILPAGPEIRYRFDREAALARAVDHPGVARLLEAGETDGYFYLATELIEGETLRQRLDRGPLPLASALDTARQLARALAAVHQQGVVHRDIKPENILLDAAGAVKLVDFGLAKQESAPSADSTSSSVAGTLGYLSPEQVRGEPATARSDVFAFGVVLYELLAGRRAFTGATGLETAAAILHHQPRALPGHLPAGLADLVGHCLRKRPEGRPAVNTTVETLQNVTGPSIRQRRLLRFGSAAATLLAIAGTLWWNRPTEVRQLYLLPFEEVTQANPQQPSLSWDGQHLAYAAMLPAGEGRKIFMVPLAGGVGRQVTFGSGDDFEPSLSPTGRQVAFRSTRVPAGLYLAATAGGEARQIASSGQQPRFSPNGAWIVYETGKWQGRADILRTDPAAIYRVPAAGGPPERLAASLGSVSSPIWFPDSSGLLLLRRRQKVEAEIWSYPFGGAPRLLRTVHAETRLQALTPEGEIVLQQRGALVRLAADGRAVWSTLRRDQLDTYTASRDGHMITGSTHRRSELWSMPAQGGVPSALVRGDGADYGFPWLSASGDRLLYTASKLGGEHSELLDLRKPSPPQQLPKPFALSADSRILPLNGVLWDAAPKGRVLPGFQDGRRAILFEQVPILQHPALHLYLASLSPDQRWIAFTGEADGHPPRIFVAPFRGSQPVPPAEWTSAGSCDYPRWDRAGSLLCLDGLSLVRRSWDPLRRQTGPPVTVTTFSGHSPSPKLLPAGWFRLAISQDRIVFPLGTLTGRLYRAQEISSDTVSRSAPLSLITSSGVNLMKKTLIFLGLLASTSQGAIVYDLKTDFSNISNPNGVWSFTQGSTNLTHFAIPGGCCSDSIQLALLNGIWSASVPGASLNDSDVMKTTANGAATGVYTNNDWLAGDVVIHGTNPGNGDLFIRWTAPQAGTITYTGGVWYAHSTVNRSQDFFVSVNGGPALNSGTVAQAQNRSNIQNFNGGLSVNAGDVLAIRFSAAAGQTFASLAGVNFTVNLEPATSGVPEPSTVALTAGALLLGALRVRRK